MIEFLPGESNVITATPSSILIDACLVCLATGAGAAWALWLHGYVYDVENSLHFVDEMTLVEDDNACGSRKRLKIPNSEA